MFQTISSAARNVTLRGYCIAAESEKMRLFIARREGLYKLNPNSKEEPAKKLASGEFIYGVDYDYTENKLFWTDRLTHSVFRADITSGGDNIEHVK